MCICWFIIQVKILRIWKYKIFLRIIKYGIGTDTYFVILQNETLHCDSTDDECLFYFFYLELQKYLKAALLEMPTCTTQD
jgi:formaldehyde-activating enzyme involved in methanogenesis